jgi:hypothetical protein
MSSVKRRIVIEEYVDGGYGILEYKEKDIMGLNDITEVLAYLRIKLEEDKNETRKRK